MISFNLNKIIFTIKHLFYLLKMTIIYDFIFYVIDFFTNRLHSLIHHFNLIYLILNNYNHVMQYVWLYFYFLFI